jgi:hypothetical protein
MIVSETVSRFYQIFCNCYQGNIKLGSFKAVGSALKGIRSVISIQRFQQRKNRAGWRCSLRSIL